MPKPARRTAAKRAAIPEVPTYQPPADAPPPPPEPAADAASDEAIRRMIEAAYT